jgi:hypothetical protein
MRLSRSADIPAACEDGSFGITKTAAVPCATETEKKIRPLTKQQSFFIWGKL